VPSSEALQRRLQTHVGMPVRQKFPLPVYRNLYSAFQHQIPGRGCRRDRIAQTERGIEQSAVRRGIQKQWGVHAFEVENDVVAVASDCRPAEQAESESLVDALDRAIKKSTPITHATDGGVDAPTFGQFPMQGHVDQPQLEIDEIGFTGQRTNCVDVCGAKAATLRQRLEVLLYVRTQQPGVLVAEKDFDAPTARRNPDRVRGTHVQAQKAER